MVLPYVKGLPEQLRRCLQQQGVCAVFKSRTTLRSELVRSKDVDISLKVNSVLKGVVFVLPYFIVKHLSDPLEIPLASRLLGPYETSFRTFDATDYQPIGKQEGLLKILIEILFGACYQLI